MVIKPLINFKVKKEKIIMISNMKAFLTLIITLFIVSTGKSQIDTIDLSSLAPNIYILNIKNQSIKLVKTK